MRNLFASEGLFDPEVGRALLNIGFIPPIFNSAHQTCWSNVSRRCITTGVFCCNKSLVWQYTLTQKFDLLDEWFKFHIISVCNLRVVFIAALSLYLLYSIIFRYSVIGILMSP